MSRLCQLFLLFLFLCACTPTPAPSAEIVTTEIPETAEPIPPGFVAADGSRPLSFPADLGAHPEYRTEWWYYTGNLDTAEGRHFGFELTIFRVGLLSPAQELPTDSQWYGRDLYFAHFALSDVGADKFYAFERYSRPGPGLAGAQAAPYHVWLDDWSIRGRSQDLYQLEAEQDGVALELALIDEMGVVLQGENGYSRKGESASNASYYYSQPRLRAEGTVAVKGKQYKVSGLAWNDHEFSTSALDKNQIGWDWFSLQFDDGRALMLFQLRERSGGISASSSGTFIAADGATRSLHKDDFEIGVLDHWRSPHTQGLYPSSWEIRIDQADCRLQIQPWMADQELRFPAVTYWEGAVHFEGACDGVAVRGNGYIEMTGYIGKVPLQ